MNRYVVSYSDDYGHIALSERKPDFLHNVLAYDNDIAAQLNSLISLSDCVIKYDQNKELVILESRDAETKVVFRFCEQILEKPELASVKEAILHNCERNGAIDITEKEIISKTPSRKSKRNDSLAKKIGTIMLYSSIVITPIVFFSSHTQRVVEPPVAYSEQVTPQEKAVPLYDNLVAKVSENADSFDTRNLMVDFNINKKEEPHITQETNNQNNHPAQKPIFENLELIEDATIEETNEQVETPAVVEEQQDSNVETSAIESSENYVRPVASDISNMPTMYLEFDDLSETDKAVKAKSLYYETIEKYSHKYGLDPNLVLGIATQERGVHSETVDAGGGIGLMQIQYSVWANQSITYYELNEETGLYEEKTMTVTPEKMAALDSNIQIGCMILQNCLVYAHYNIPVAVDMYNKGIGTLWKILDGYAAEKGVSRSDILNNPADTGWLNNRSTYVKAINQWVFDNWFTVINVKTGEPVSFNFTNDNEQAIHGR